MGTNYYVAESRGICPSCKRPHERYHIGKSSAGWVFSLHVIPELGLDTLVQWTEFWKGKVIFDEYDRIVSAVEMVDIISNRPMYNNRVLIRHPINGWNCTGHGPGTFDYIVGEFC